jgi:hypothetical protein
MSTGKTVCGALNFYDHRVVVLPQHANDSAHQRVIDLHGHDHKVGARGQLWHRDHVARCHIESLAKDSLCDAAARGSVQYLPRTILFGNRVSTGELKPVTRGLPEGSPAIDGRTHSLEHTRRLQEKRFGIDCVEMRGVGRKALDDGKWHPVDVISPKNRDIYRLSVPFAKSKVSCDRFREVGLFPDSLASFVMFGCALIRNESQGGDLQRPSRCFGDSPRHVIQVGAVEPD